MAHLEVRTHIEAPPDRVWATLSDWEAQPRWMRDARDVTVTSPHREGVGVTLRVPTDLLAGRGGGRLAWLADRLLVDDTMEVTAWDPPRRIAVRHHGPLVTGTGAWELAATPHGTAFTWSEDLRPPFGLLGEVVARAAVLPWVARTFRTSVAALKRLCESAAVRPA